MISIFFVEECTVIICLKITYIQCVEGLMCWVNVRLLSECVAFLCIKNT
jgi:hypothetical protein